MYSLATNLKSLLDTIITCILSFTYFALRIYISILLKCIVLLAFQEKYPINALWWQIPILNVIPDHDICIRGLFSKNTRQSIIPMTLYHSIFSFTFSLYNLASLRKLFQIGTKIIRANLNGNIPCPEIIISQLTISTSFLSYLLSIHVNKITRPSGNFQKKLQSPPLLLLAFAGNITEAWYIRHEELNSFILSIIHTQFIPVFNQYISGLKSYSNALHQ